MSKMKFVVALALVVATTSYAYDDRDELKWNPYDDRHSYESKESSLRYNPYEDRHEYAEEGESLKYNPYEDSWEYAR